VFQFFEHPVHFAREQAYEGKYIIQTEEKNLSPLEAVRLYKELSEVERALANIKGGIEMRPIYHRDANRVKAHVLRCSSNCSLFRRVAGSAAAWRGDRRSP
jgi:transposase